ncbi:MAG: cupin domain-containing protein [Thermomicrobia bacterium]|nr:cupin domain-containing protein [Thermomicrobia bacterium]
MRIYGETDSPWRCGHWNGSPIEILFSDFVTSVPVGEAYHYHNFHEYYVILRGRAILHVEGQDVPMEAESVVMVQPGERHRVTWVDPDAGVQWIVVKERSVPGSKIVVPEPGDTSPLDRREDA